MTDPNMRGTPPSRHPDSNTTTSTSTAPSTTTGSNTNGNNSSSGPSNVSHNTSNTTPSLATRIQSSATGLARSALTGDYAQTLHTATQGKGSSSRSSSSSNPEITHQATGPGLPSGSSSSSSTTRQAQTFRSAPSPSGAFSIPNLTEEEFQRVYTDVGTYGRAYYDEAPPSQSQEGLAQGSASGTAIGIGNESPSASANLEEFLQSSTGNWKGKQRPQDPVQLEYTTAWERATPHPTYSHPPVTYLEDGSEVINLLKDPNFDALAPEEAEMEAEAELEISTLTDSEMAMLDSFRRELSLDSSSNAAAAAAVAPREVLGQRNPVPLSSGSLVPDIDTFLQNDSSRNQDAGLRDRVLSELTGSNEWVEVQERYHDEVWGYLRPALEAAREEIEQREEGGEGEGHGDGDGPAVRRLKMILKHMSA